MSERTEKPWQRITCEKHDALTAKAALVDELAAALQQWSDYFDKLDRDSDPDDPLATARKIYHAKRLEATRAVLAKVKGG